MRTERPTYSPETTTTTIKRMFLLGCTLKQRVMEKFGVNEYCEMLLIYDECGREAKLAARLYRERFPEGTHPTRQTILKVLKHLRETDCVTSRLRVRRPRNVGRKVQPEDLLAYDLAHPPSRTNMISEKCSLSKSRVWTILKESGAHPYIKWKYEACFSRNVHTCSLENRKYTVEFRHQLRWSINVWCESFNHRLIGPVFDEGTLTAQRYLKLLQDVITDFLENLPLHQLRNVWFQHDDAPPHKIPNFKQYLI
ncbi:hypothetical protein AVEN_57193-1 [Araneus ventricosus]|uniref:DUF4817 domain-containing protein n=1 Tax=Araneus ventricosus TaxID=182803 RepID=A0A4Y2RAD4_ARAVE|nr:hypothetical protein AVEN_57193-1 [Araneus ventricosus]